MVESEEVRRLEQKWLVLSDLFGDLQRRKTKVSVVDRLRNCKTLLHFIQAETHPKSRALEESIDNLRHTLEDVKLELFSAMAHLDEAALEDWIKEVDKAEQGLLEKSMEHRGNTFMPELFKRGSEGWMRLTLQAPISEQKLQSIAEKFNVAVSLENERHIIVSGEKDRVKQAVRGIYNSVADKH